MRLPKIGIGLGPILLKRIEGLVGLCAPKLILGLLDVLKFGTHLRWVFTSLVFQRWRCVGKWSDFGSDSRDSGSLMGSPSGEEKISIKVILLFCLGYHLNICDFCMCGLTLCVCV